ncbi:MAG: bifunctional 4-hydroxy-2-oxoglutarate aldolase/2-dehydro-3-deoxy-phosphogluconate aldolase [Eubacteriales bacterium]
MEIDMEAIEYIKEKKIVPVVVLNSLEDTIPTLGALCDGGLKIAEITFRTECAADAIKLGVRTFPDMLIGAGTVINAQQAQSAIDCGSKFIVGPGFSAEVAAVCRKNGIIYLPGCVTPTEMIAAISCGIDIVKFFPASDFGGLKAIKSLAAAFPSLKFLPTGGINSDNLLEYLSFPKIIACGGSWMMKGSADDIREKTKAAVSLVENA